MANNIFFKISIKLYTYGEEADFTVKREISDFINKNYSDIINSVDVMPNTHTSTSKPSRYNLNPTRTYDIDSTIILYSQLNFIKEDTDMDELKAEIIKELPKKLRWYLLNKDICISSNIESFDITLEKL